MLGVLSNVRLLLLVAVDCVQGMEQGCNLKQKKEEKNRIEVDKCAAEVKLIEFHL